MGDCRLDKLRTVFDTTSKVLGPLSWPFRVLSPLVQSPAYHRSKHPSRLLLCSEQRKHAKTSQTYKKNKDCGEDYVVFHARGSRKIEKMLKVRAETSLRTTFEELVSEGVEI